MPGDRYLARDSQWSGVVRESQGNGDREWNIDWVSEPAGVGKGESELCRFNVAMANVSVDPRESIQ